MKRALLIPPLLAALLATAACGTLRSDYDAPQVNVSNKWRYSASSAATGETQMRGSGAARGFAVETDRWWNAFNDARLTRFVDSVVASNNNLAAAAVAARRARLQANLNGAQLGPQVSAGVDGSQSSEQDANASYSANGSISYELDLWGRLDALRDVAMLEAEASEEDRQATALSLTGSAVTLYWQLAYMNLQITSAQESLAYAERTQRLVQAQYAAGAVSGLEVSEAEQTVQSQRASLTQLTQSRVETRNAIAALRDGQAWPEDDEPTELPDILLNIDAGIPAQILAQRPDLRAAELRLRETLASGDASRLSYYPSIGLTASGGGASTSLSSLLADPVGSIAGNLTLPFLQANEMHLASRISAADYEAAALNFRQTLREALVEVENALSAQTHLAQRGQQLAAALTASQTAERLYEARYRAGAVGLREWLDAQERRRQADLTGQQNRVNELSNQVTLFMALGGGLAT